jgi:hypothetical protein
MVNSQSFGVYAVFEVSFAGLLLCLFEALLVVNGEW